MQLSTLLCTVGTSLFYSNLSSLDPLKYCDGVSGREKRIGKEDRESLSRAGLLQNRTELESILLSTKNHFDTKNWGHLAKQLLNLPPDLRLCGAEINSIEAMSRKKFFGDERNRLILLVSDTDDGAAIGAILKTYFEDRKCPIGFKSCEYKKVAGLQDEAPLIFRTKGLTNLVRMLGSELSKWGNEGMGINATGGYKAQIGLAVAFGQAAHCPVFYKHERFDQIIQFPQVPFALDLSMVEDHLKLWADLAEDKAMLEKAQFDGRLSEREEIKEAIYPLLEEETIDGVSYVTLSALGLVYWEAYSLRNPEEMLEPPSVSQRRDCHFRDDHYPIGFKEYVEKVYESFPSLISECHSLPFSGQQGINRNRFYIKEGRIIGEYVDKNNFGARFEIMTAATNELERRWVCRELEKGLM
jgi:putative CRISPR-associated protein (TIGR02619 family)